MIPMKPPDDRGFAPNVDLCLLAFIFLAFPFALSFPCLPSHPESATCDFWERTGASGAWAWDYTPNLPLCYWTVGPSPRVAESLPTCPGNLRLTQIHGSTYRRCEKALCLSIYSFNPVSSSMQAASPHPTVVSA